MRLGDYKIVSVDQMLVYSYQVLSPGRFGRGFQRVLGLLEALDFCVAALEARVDDR